MAVKWRRVNDEGAVVPVGLPITFLEAMERAFGKGPWRLGGERDRERIFGMLAVWPDETGLRALREALSVCDLIEVWVEEAGAPGVLRGMGRFGG